MSAQRIDLSSGSFGSRRDTRRELLKWGGGLATAV